jgi:hypothetical protein
MPKLRSTGGIFWRLDASGNLTAYDTSGTVLGKFIGGVFSAKQNLATLTGGAGVTTVSTSFVSTGEGVSVKSQISGFVTIIAQIAGRDQTTANGVVAVNIVENTTGIPALGVSIGTDTLQNGANIINSSTTFSISATIVVQSSVVAGQTTYFYVAFKSPVGTDTVNAAVIGMIVVEQ